VTTGPRGIRNHNPGNIRATKLYTWRGQTGADADGFCEFAEPKDGIRAMAILLSHYARYNECYTISRLICRWAPTPGSSRTDYIEYVAGRLSIDSDEIIEVDDLIIDLVKAIIFFENAMQPYPEAVIDIGINEAAVR